MKTKTSLSLSRDVLKGIDRVAGRRHSRSAVIDAVLRRYLEQRERARINAEDGEKLDRYADELNAEALDVVGYQDLDAVWDERR
jgi:Arc/MetJ-type ribon-helix-helix transcriptional regulator